jgi:very-short-patch-repair endonuclease
MVRPVRSNPKTLHRAAALRREPTPAESRLWSRLRNHQLQGVGFRRQHAVGSYIVDFCAPRTKLVIELDGSQHAEHRPMTSSEPLSWRERVTEYCGSGTMT